MVFLGASPIILSLCIMYALALTNTTVQSLSHNFATEIKGNFILLNAKDSLAFCGSCGNISSSFLCCDCKLVPSSCLMDKGVDCCVILRCGDFIVKKFPEAPL